MVTKNEIDKLRVEGMTYTAIGKMFGVSWQRIHQVHTGYSSKKIKNPKEHKILTPKKRLILGIPDNPIKSGQRDRVREWVRIRDNRTCQNCGKRWQEGERRLDVHHIDDNMQSKSHLRGAAKWDLENMHRLVTLCHKCHFNFKKY